MPASIVIFGDKVRGPVKIAGMAFQNANLLPWRKVIDNVLLPLEIVEPHRQRFRQHKEEYREQANALLKTVGLDGFGERFPWELSGGMQQRVSLCRALIHEPALLMLDEPFAALDAFTREELWCVLRDLWQKLGFTVILVTHDLREAAFLADNIHVMSARPGRIVHDQDRRSAAPARPRHLLRAALHRHRARIARQDRRGAQGMNTTLEKLSPWLFTIGLFAVLGSGLPHLQDRQVHPAGAVGGVRGDGAVLAAAAAPFARDACGPPWPASRSRSRSASCSG